ncbi:MAG: prephenate dehydrogenase [Sedimentisphaerales bacterium]|nr:prephenate dehydrogenase [Sedimentisphaerales bacterium]
MKDLRQITIIGTGLLGSSLALAAGASFSDIKVVAFSHRASTRKKARRLLGDAVVVDELTQSVLDSDIVILAAPIYTFEGIFKAIKSSLKKGAIVTDVGSSKVLPHKWAKKCFQKTVHYVGSHPIAGSEQRGIEFARDDLFDGADCIITSQKSTNKKAVSVLKKFWSKIGCRVIEMTPAQHDRIFAGVSHLSHITAVSLVNANNDELLKFAGKGFMDTTRVASSPANIWLDILMANSDNCVKGIDNIIDQLGKFKKAIQTGDSKKTKILLDSARNKRAKLIKDKLRKREMIP